MVTGEVMYVSQDGLLINIGHKSEGFIPVREMKTLPEEEAGSFKIGDEVYAYVLRPR